MNGGKSRNWSRAVLLSLLSQLGCPRHNCIRTFIIRHLRLCHSSSRGFLFTRISMMLMKVTANLKLSLCEAYTDISCFGLIASYCRSYWKKFESHYPMYHLYIVFVRQTILWCLGEVTTRGGSLLRMVPD